MNAGKTVFAHLMDFIPLTSSLAAWIATKATTNVSSRNSDPLNSGNPEPSGKSRKG